MPHGWEKMFAIKKNRKNNCITMELEKKGKKYILVKSNENNNKSSSIESRRMSLSELHGWNLFFGPHVMLNIWQSLIKIVNIHLVVNMSKKSSYVGIAVKYTNSNHLWQRKKKLTLPVEGSTDHYFAFIWPNPHTFFYLISHSTRLNSIEWYENWMLFLNK